MRMTNLEDAIELIKQKLGLDIKSAVVENDWCGDTEVGFYTEYEVDMDKLNEEIDRFSEMLARRSE